MYICRVAFEYEIFSLSLEAENIGIESDTASKPTRTDALATPELSDDKAVAEETCC